MNLRPGIDTPPPKNFIYVKLNFPFDDQDKCIAVLKDIERIRREALAPDRLHEGEPVVAGWGLNLLVAFGLRFFLGPLAERQKVGEEAVPNFPPGGIFTPRIPTRFGIKYKVPIYLRTMNAAADNVFVGRRLSAELGREATAEEINEAYVEWLSDNESDIFIYIEANNPELCEEVSQRLHNEVIAPNNLDVVSIDVSWGTGDGRDLIGWHDPRSNMDDLLGSNPYYYRTKIYLPHPAPYFPGENSKNRDDTRFNGGTYMVHRKYIEHLDKWNAEDFSITNNYGKTFHGEAARNQAIGRDRETGQVISGSDGSLLDVEPDATEANLAPLDSHILQARGGNPAPFKGPFPPVKAGEENSFHIQDIRIRRRGGNWRKTDGETGKTIFGLHFICFQNNIQQTGFEFINNIWLLNPSFRLNHDHLLDPDKGIGEPVGGCYFFVPPLHRLYPGEVFFD